MSNWNHNTIMTSTKAEVYPPYTMGTSQTKPVLADSDCVINSGVSSNRSFSTLGIGIFSNILQKVTNIFTNMLPTIAQINTLERNKQSLSSPDILVDININTPIFESAHGKALLTVPDECSCDQTESISDGNYLFNWCPIEEKVNEMSSINCQKYGMYKRIVRVVYNQTSSSISKDSSIRARCANDRPLNICNPKGCNINCKEKDRYNLLNDIEDFQLIFDDNEFDSNIEIKNPIQSLEYGERNGFCSIPFSPNNIKSVLDLSEESSTAICSPIAVTADSEVSDDGRKSRPSESDSENSFVILSENVQMATPTASPHIRRDLCKTINNLFTYPVLERQQRQRQLSECSDDSIVFCYESDQDENVCQNGTDFDSDDGSEAEPDEHNCEDDSKDTESHQPDSGFEERKVQFNLNPEVHVMRTWDFAYRQARKGDWEMAARDRERFRKRILKTEDVLSIVFDKNVRDRVYQDRFN